MSKEKTNVVQVDFNGHVYEFRDDGWFNATMAAKYFGKEPYDWLVIRDTVEYVEALAKFMTGNSRCEKELNEIKELYTNKTNTAVFKARLLKLAKATGYVITKGGSPESGGGTWFHPKLAVPFARWLDTQFAVWCDFQIEGLLRGTHTHHDWKRMRHTAASSYKVVGQILKLTRERLGKPTESHHYSNEARLINWALTGKFGSVDREGLSIGDLDLLAKLENMDTVLIGCDMPYEQRKSELARYAAECRVAVPMLKAA